MSTSIGYKPVDPAESTYVEGGATFWKIITDEYGHNPTIGEHEIGWLRGVESCGWSGARTLINAIQEHGRIALEVNT